MNLKSCRVRDYMVGQLTTFSPNGDVLDAIHVLVKHRIAGAPVVNDQGELVGMLSELDCLKVALNAGYYGDWGGPVADYMTPDVETVDAEMNIIDLAQKFLDSGYRRFPVLRGNRLVGQISRRDVLRALGELAVSS
jgi:CBS domain-containing protein